MSRRQRTLLIAYEPGTRGNPDAIIAVIQAVEEWWHYLTCVWVVRSPEGPRAWTNKLQPYIKPGDRLLVFEVTPSYFGILPRAALDWLSDHVRKAAVE